MKPLKKMRYLFAALCFAVTGDSAAQTSILYEQSWNFDYKGVQSSTRHQSPKQADDFTVDEDFDWSVTSMSWVGILMNYTPNLQESIRVDFFSANDAANDTANDMADGPARHALHSFDVLADFQYLGVGSSYGDRAYRFSTDFVDPIFLDAGTTYWVSINNRRDERVQYFFLGQDAETNQTLYSRSRDNVSWSTHNSSGLAFTLMGDALEPVKLDENLRSVFTPTPHSLLLTGLVALFFGMTIKQKRHDFSRALNH